MVTDLLNHQDWCGHIGEIFTETLGMSCWGKHYLIAGHQCIHFYCSGFLLSSSIIIFKTLTLNSCLKSIPLKTKQMVWYQALLHIQLTQHTNERISWKEISWFYIGGGWFNADGQLSSIVAHSFPFLKRTGGENVMRKDSWIEIRAGRSLTHCCQRQNRLSIGRIM